ncbi:uncharacterized protein LOC8062803 [Sorghum bicolor]|uniref:Bifunctional inhibitor/plant lipid transfer protein/seed storage helical domain-containing protein n=1 Tax=Sorghum bicolor TaxID=4558 RepID=C5WP24_SORBI|nr:uncharacterized protein LOC8062803 [Sorghum bicolor]EER94345.1 hypothetical protein SORBI_3001G266500 [Sorghum bicolor]|eukprot:XP_002467347.1 uncharacterized protein LOC8062803 [Sorghum bicolor]
MSQLSPAGRLAATFLLIILAAAAAISAQQVPQVPGPHDPQASGCQNDIDALWRSCKQFVQKDGPEQPPSEGCCKTLKATDADAPCICDYLSSPDAKDKLSMEKVFYVTKHCGITIPKGCGLKQVA